MARRMVLVIVAVLALAGCSNPSTDAGDVGYVVKKPWFGQRRFYALQTGPASTGLGWMLSVYNINITPSTSDEDFKGEQSVLGADKLRVSFSAHLTFKIKPERVRELWEHYSQGLDEKTNEVNYWGMYNSFIQQRFRNIVRDAVTQYNGLEVQAHIEPISASITKRMHEFLDPTPFEVIAAIVGNIQYPESVANAVANKLAVTQDLERERTNIAIITVKAQQRVAEARGIADSMAIINNQLTPIYLQHEAIQAQEKMVQSQNHTEIYIPTGPMGVPLVNAQNVGQK